MKRKLYHGSQNIIEKPIWGYGKKYNDYGLGFYCTENIDMAKEWGVFERKDGYANCYELECDGLHILDLNSEGYCILHWLSILLQNREFDILGGLALEAREYLLKNFSVDYENFDAIIGYRADDSYFSFAQDFVAGAISYRQLGEAMKLGSLGEQIVLISEKAFDRIKYVSNSPADASVYYKKKKERDRLARKAYRNTKSEALTADELLIVDIIREGMTQNDERLR